MKEPSYHQFLLQHSAYADTLEKTHSKETEWARHHKPYEKTMPIKRKFTAKLKEEQNAYTESKGTATVCQNAFE